MLRTLKLLAAVATGLVASSCHPGEEDLVRYVNPLIGTAPGTTLSARRHSEFANEPKGQTFPAVGTPFALTSWTPQTRDSEQKCLSPYYYDDDHIQGFRGSHWMSGSCTQDYGSVTLMPMSGALHVSPAARASRFSHTTEITTPAYYAVTLDSYGIRAEMTGAERTGMFRFTFPRHEPAFVVLQPNSDEGQGYVEIRPERNEIVGYNPVHRIYQGWGQPAGFSGYFVARFDKPFSSFGIWKDSLVADGIAEASGEGGPVAAWVELALGADSVTGVTVGTSFTSIEQARANLEADAANKRFEAVRTATEAAWNEALGRIRVEGGPPDGRTPFYTALYHAMLLPRTFSDADGSYPRFAGNYGVQKNEGFTYYDDFSAWDTFRALHPLLTLLEPERTSDMVRSLVAKAEQGGWMPIFPCWNNYTSAMIGDHTTAIVADAYLKGIGGFDAEKAYAAMVQNATRVAERDEYIDGKGRRALDSYLRYGYIPLEDSVTDAFHKNEQVSRTLEYAFDDFALSQFARKLGEQEMHRQLLDRAANYRHVLDTTTGFVRGRHADGRWAEPFDPRERQTYITEGTPWHYTWFVPHDVQGLIDRLGGRNAFVERLDTLFEQGLYWHGNEPSHQIAFLYSFAGAPWKTQQRVRQIMEEEYGAGPGGLSGNDDAGQMSAWYVFAAVGLYPVAPGAPYYVLSSPTFERVTFHLQNGRTFTIEGKGASAQNRYIQRARLNGKVYDQPWISHFDLLRGGRLELTLGPVPNPSWGAGPESAPPSLTGGGMDRLWETATRNEE